MTVSDTGAFGLSWLHALETANQACVAELILKCAVERKESRGCHFRDDFPEEDPSWNRRIVVRCGPDGEHMTLDPVKYTYVAPPSREQT